jgi:hypothetical protein
MRVVPSDSCAEPRCAGEKSCEGTIPRQDTACQTDANLSSPQTTQQFFESLKSASRRKQVSKRAGWLKQDDMNSQNSAISLSTPAAASVKIGQDGEKNAKFQLRFTSFVVAVTLWLKLELNRVVIDLDGQVSVDVPFDLRLTGRIETKKLTTNGHAFLWLIAAISVPSAASMRQFSYMAD